MQVGASDDGLLFARVRDLRDRWDRPVIWCFSRRIHAAVIAIADGPNAIEALLVWSPHLSFTGFHAELHVHEDPTATARALLAKSFWRHEIVGRLHSDAHVLLVRTIWQF